MVASGEFQDDAPSAAGSTPKFPSLPASARDSDTVACPDSPSSSDSTLPHVRLERRNKLRRQLKQEGLDALLVTNFKNVTYLTGFTGDDSYLLVAPSRATC